MKKNITKLAVASLLATGVLTHTNAQDEEEEIFELSPFQVEASDNEGYRASTTLAGSRVRSNIKDLGSSISIVTKEFLSDTGATDGESLLAFVGNVEVGGVQGNFSNSNLGDASTNGSRNNPQSAQRVRGLVSAKTTRDYFDTMIPFDSYNTERVTINKGPNSILFGLGSPGGVINNSTSQANIGNDSGEFSIRIGERGTYRTSFNYNKTLVEDRLAIRVAALKEEIQFEQNPAMEEDDRFFVALSATLFKNDKSDILGKTNFRASYENGKIFRNPPDVAPPIDGFSSWFEGIGDQETLNNILRVPGVSLSEINNNVITEDQVRGAVAAGLATVPEGMTLDEYAAAEGNFGAKSVYDRFNNRFIANEDDVRKGTNASIPYFIFPAINYNSGADGSLAGWDDPALAGIEGIMGRWRPNGFPVQDVRWTTPATGGTGFRSNSIMDRNVFDYHRSLFQGNTNEVTTEFDLYQAVIDQSLFNGNAGIEVAFDKQERTQDRFNAFSSGNSKQVWVDITPDHASADSDFDGTPDRTPNENVGRAVILWNDNTKTADWNNRETLRATAFGKLNFRDFMSNDRLGNILGDHTLTLLYEDNANDNGFRQTRGSWWADEGIYPGAGSISNGRSDNFRRIVKSQVYISPDLSGLNDAGQVRLNNVNVRIPQVGDEYGIWYFNNAGNVDAGEINTWRIIENVQNANLARTELTSDAFSLQSKFFGGNLVALWARRHDELKAFQRLQHTQNYGQPGTVDAEGNPILPLRLDAFEINPDGTPGAKIIAEDDGDFNEGLLFLEPEPNAVNEDYTTTTSVVMNYPENWLGELPWGMDISAHYYEADSWQPAGISNNVLNEQLASPTGKTREKGITVTLFDGKLSIRYNEFKTANANARTNLGGQVDDVVGQIGFFLTRLAEAENGGVAFLPSTEFRDELTTPEGVMRSDADLSPTTLPSNRQRQSGTDADILGVSSYDEYYQKIIDILPTEIQNIYDYRVVRNEGRTEIESNTINGLNSTRDFVASGKEIDIVGQLSRNFTVSLNVAQQQTVTSNTGPVAIPLAYEIEQRLLDAGFAEVRDSPFQLEQTTTDRRYAGVTRALRIQEALDNTLSQEQREWRVNFVPRYSFLEGPLKGLAIGTPIRYQDEVAAGYPNLLNEDGAIIPDVANPFLGPDSLNADLFVSYRKKIMNDKIDWTIQFNARNIYRGDGDDDIPVFYNPDGRVARIRIPNAQEFYLTNTFKF